MILDLPAPTPSAGIRDDVIAELAFEPGSTPAQIAASIPALAGEVDVVLAELAAEGRIAPHVRGGWVLTP